MRARIASHFWTSSRRLELGPFGPQQRTCGDSTGMPVCARMRHGQDSVLYFLHRKSSFRSAGFQYTHGNALSVEGRFSFKDLVELQGDMLS
jgi:hypothetical protein